MATLPTTPKHLPRYKRAQREVGFIFTKRDLEILRIVESFRLVNSEHLQALVEGSNQGILRRLQKLFHAGHLDRISPLRVNGGGSAKMVYAITNRGFRELQKAGLIEEPTKTDWNAQNRTLADLSVNHTLLISHVRAVLTAACSKNSDLRLLFWKEGRDIYDSIEVALNNGYERVPVAPDAFIGLQDAEGRFYFFLEADRGTMTVKRFTLKLKAFAAYWRKKKHREKFGIRNFRVLTVTQSGIRQANLVTASEEADDVRELGRWFFFTQDQKLSLDRPESILKNIWTMPASQELHSILD